MTESLRKTRVLFVCTGNICRSPTAEGVFRSLVEQAGLAGSVEVDSAGTHGYHVGEPPDERAQEEAAARGYDLSAITARRVEPEDFKRFDLVVAMDSGHHAQLSRMVPPGAAGRLCLFMDFAAQGAQGAQGDQAGRGADVPDPYYGARDGFTEVLDMIEAGSRGLLDSLRRERP